MSDLSIVGLGLVPADHLTPQAERAIRASNEVLYLDTGVATRELLLGLCPRVTSLFEESYAEGGARLPAYHHMAARVVEAALDHRPVTFAIQGHPTVGVHAPFLVRDMARLLGLSVEVLPGVSSMDALFAGLLVDPCPLGLQMFEATDLLLRRRPLAPDVPLLIWQVGTVETRLHSTRPSRPERFVRLRDHLLRFYPPDHPVTAFHAPSHPLMRQGAVVFTLSDLTEHAGSLHAGVTLYLPPAAERPIEDVELLGLVDDPEHLRRVTI